MRCQEDNLLLPPAVSDEALAQRAWSGDEEAFELLVRRYDRALFAMILRSVHNAQDASDILQHVLLQLYLSLDSFHRGKPIQAWLFRVARYRCIDHVRQKRLVSFSELGGMGEDEHDGILQTIAAPDPLSEEIAEYHEIRQRCYFAIQALPPRYAQVLFLHSIAQLSFAEISLQLAIPVATAKTYFYRGRTLLRGTLEAHGFWGNYEG